MGHYGVEDVMHSAQLKIELKSIRGINSQQQVEDYSLTTI
jgi:hypothetical protein